MKRWQIRGAPNRKQLDEIAALLRDGGVVLLPTDTIYGLHALATDEMAAKIARIKGRHEGKAFVIVAASVAQLESMGAAVPEVLRNLWPAPLTAVLRGGTGTMAARIPDLAWLRDLLAQTGPLFSTSANRSRETPISQPDDLAPELVMRIDGIVDAGRREGKASAIVDFTGTEPRFIREGDASFAQTLRKTQLKKL